MSEATSNPAEGGPDRPSAIGPDDGSRPLPAIRYFGDYVLLGKIAEGGMGIVWRARQISLNKKVALKIMKASQFDAAAVTRFRTEAEAMAQLDHPHIVPIYEVGEHEGNQYFSMRLVEGHDLAQEIADKPLPARRTAEILVTVARAVHHAHQRGVLHRDLKPSNIVLEETDAGPAVPNITDFGLAKLIEEQPSRGQTATMAIMGTVEYMAPEQAEGKAKHLTTAADIYSLGAILYVMLTGRPPFEQQPDEEGQQGRLSLLRRVAESDPPPPRTLNRGCDRDLETICLKCLEKNPRHRFGSADALADDLDRWLRDEPILARPATIWDRVSKWARRKPAIAVMSALLVLSTVGGFAAVFQQLGRTKRAARQTEAVLSLSRAFTRALRPEVDASDRENMLEIIERRIPIILPDRLDMQAALNADLGAVYSSIGAWAKAEAAFTNALALSARTRDSAAIGSGSLSNSLAVVLQKQGKREAATPYYSASLAALLQIHGPDHSSVSVVRKNLAFNLRRLGQYEEAEKLYQAELETIGRLRTELRNKMRITDQTSAQFRALDKRDVQLRWDRGHVTAHLVRTLLDARKFADAEPLAKWWLKSIKAVSPDGWETNDAMSLLGGSLLGQGEHEKARPLLIDGYDGLRRLEAQLKDLGRSALLEAFRRLAEYYISHGTPAEVAEWKQKLAEAESSSGIAQPRLE